MNTLCDGDFSVRVGSAGEGILAEMAGVFNRIVARNDHLAEELQRVRHALVQQGRLDERIAVSPGQGNGHRASTQRTHCSTHWWYRSRRRREC